MADQVITVSLQLNTKDFDAATLASGRQAQALAKAVKDSLTIQSKPAVDALKAVGQEKDKLLKNFQELRRTIKDTFDIKVGAANRNIASVNKSVVELTTKANAAATAMKSIKFTIGQTNRNLDSVIGKLEKLEKTAGRVGTVSTGVNTTGGGKGGGTTEPSSSTSPPTITIQKDEPYRGAGPERPDATLLLDAAKKTEQRIRQERGYTAKEMQEVLAREAKARDEYTKKALANAETVRVKNKAIMEESARMTSSIYSSLAGSTNKVSSSVSSLKNKISSAYKSIQSDGEGLALSFSKLFSASFFGNLAATGFNSLLNAFKAVSIETVEYAARTQELGVVLNSLARVNSISTGTILEQEIAMRRLNITTQDARETLARFINVGFDVKQAGPLARVAQDLAVISGFNTSEELDKLLVGIQTLQSRNLRTAGVYITVDEVLDRLARTTGRARDSFSTLEKQQAVLNAVMEYGTKVAGSYEAAMLTASKQQRSLDRLYKEAQNALGEGLIPAYGAVIELTGTFLSKVGQYPGLFSGAINGVVALSAALIVLRTNLISSIGSGFKSGLGALSDIAAGVTGGETIKQRQAKEALFDLSTKRQSLILQNQLNEAQIAELTATTQTANARKEILRNKIAQNSANINKLQQQEQDIANPSRISKIGEGIGKIFAVGATAVGIYQILDGIVDASRALETVKPVDISFTQKIQNDYNNALNNQRILLEANSGATENQVRLNKELADVSNTIQQKTQQSLDLDILRGDIAKGTVEYRKKQLEYVQLELQSLEKAKQVELDKGVLQIQIANKNRKTTEESLKDLDAAREILQGLPNIPDNPLTIGGKKIVQYQNYIYGTIGFESDSSYIKQSARRASLGIGTKSSAEGVFASYAPNVYEQAQKARVEEQQALEQFVKQAEILHKNPIELFRETSQNRDSAYLDEVSEKLAQIQKKAAALKQQTADVLTGKVGVDAAFKAVLDDFARTAYSLAEARLKDFSVNNPTATKQQRNEAYSGFLTDALSSTYKDELGQGIQSRLVSVLASRAAGQGQVLSPDQARLNLQDAFDKQDIVETYTVVDQSGKVLAETQVNLTKSYLDQARTQKILDENTKVINQQFEELGLAIDPLTRQFEDLVNTDFFKAQQDFFKDKAYSGSKQLTSVGFEIGKSPEEIRNLVTQAEGLASYDPQRAEEFVRTQLEVFNRQKAVQDGQRELEQLRKPNLELERINKEKELVQAQRELENLRSPDKETQRLQNELEKTQRQIKIEQQIKDFKNQQKDAEDEIAVLKVTTTLPAVNAQLLAEKAILQTIQTRRQEEQQLTADIAVEIDKRNRYSLNSAQEISRLTAEVFLDAQKQERQTQEDAIKNVLGFALQTGNTSVFENNPLIQEAIKQSEQMAEIDKKGGEQLVKLEEANNISKDIKVASIKTNELLINLATSFAQGINTLSENIANTFAAGQSGAAGGTGFDRLFNAFVGQESGGNPGATNRRTGASGIGQILPKYYASYAALAGVPNTTFEQYKSDPTLQRTVVYNSLQKLYQNAQQLAGGDENLAVRMLASRWYTGSFTNYNSNKIPGLGEPSPAQYANSILGRYRGIKSVPLPTQSVISNIQTAAPKPKITKVTYEGFAKELGLTTDEYNKLLEIGNIKTVDDAKTVFSSAALFKQFGNTFAQGADAQAIGDFAKETTSKLQAQDVQRAMLNVRKLNADMIIDLDTTAQLLEYEQELSDFDSGITTADTLTKLGILKDRIANLDDKGSSEYNKVVGEAELARAQRFYDLKAETIKLDNEEYYRRTNQVSYLAEQDKKFANQQISDKQSIQDSERELWNRVNGFRDKSSQYYLNLIAKEKQARGDAAQNLTEEIDALERYNREYLNSEENRTRISKEEYKSRLEAYRDTVESTRRLDEETNNVSYGLFERLENKKAQLRNSNAKQYENALMRQLELENEINNVLSGDKATEAVNARVAVLESVRGKLKSESELIVGVFNDTFDALNSQFGAAVDRTFNKLGAFGGILGNLFKGITSNILGKLQKDLGDKLFPSTVDTISKTPQDKATEEFTKQAVGASVGVVASANNLIAANNGLQVSMYNAAQSIGGAGNIFINVAATMAEAIQSILGAIGGVGGAGGTGTGGGGGAAIQAAVAKGTAGIGLATSGNAPVASASIGSSDITSVTAATAIGNEIGSRTGQLIGGKAGGTVGGILSKGIGSIFSKGGLKTFGGSLLSSAPLLGASLGGSLGGSSAVGGLLGQAGGAVAGLAGLATAFGISGGTIGSSIFGVSGILGGLGTTFAGIGSALAPGLGAAGAAALGATVVLAPLAVGLLVGAYLLGRNKRRRQEERVRDKAIRDVFDELDKMIGQVRSNKLDGEEAVSRAGELRQQYIDEMNKLKDSKTRKHALQDVSRIDAKIDQLKAAAKQQQIRREIDERIIPTYAGGGYTNSEYIRVSQGESLFVPSSQGTFSGDSLASAGIPGFSGGGMYTGARIRGRFDGKDNILLRVPKGTVIANPRQVQKAKQSRGYASGGVAGGSVSTAQGGIVIQPPAVTAIIVFSTEEAEKLGAQIPNSVIVSKVRHHVKETGQSGLAGDVLNQFRY